MQQDCFRTAHITTHAVDHQVMATMQERVYQIDIHNADELTQRQIQFWCNVDQNIINRPIRLPTSGVIKDF